MILLAPIQVQQKRYVSNLSTQAEVSKQDFGAVMQPLIDSRQEIKGKLQYYLAG